MLNSLYDKIRLNLKFEQAFVLVLDNILGPSVVRHHDRKVSHVIIVTLNSV